MDAAKQAQSSLMDRPERRSVARDLRFDVLKTIGILSIILAHIIPERGLLFQLRNFDVPLMVIASGALFYLSSRNKEFAFFPYLLKRATRLLLPVWLFLMFYFAATYSMSAIANRRFPYSLVEMMGSFTLLTSFEYVWIIRVFILIAVLSPIILKLRRACSTATQFLIAILLIDMGYELTLALVGDLENPLADGALTDGWMVSCMVFTYVLFEKIVFPAVAYSCLFGVGMILPIMRKASVARLAIAAATLFTILTIHYHASEITDQLLVTQDYKYPPQLYFMSYGVALSALLYLVVDRLQQWQSAISASINPFSNLIVFISTSTLWIYLWHIFFVENLWVFSFRKNYALLFLIVTTLSIGMTYLQKRFIQNLTDKTRWGQNHAEFLSVLFLR